MSNSTFPAPRTTTPPRLRDMAIAIAELADETGAVLEINLIARGFTRAEIARYGESALAIAHDTRRDRCDRQAYPDPDNKGQ